MDLIHRQAGWNETSSNIQRNERLSPHTLQVWPEIPKSENRERMKNHIFVSNDPSYGNVDEAPDENADYHQKRDAWIKAKFHQSRDKDLSKHQGK